MVLWAAVARARAVGTLAPCPSTALSPDEECTLVALDGWCGEAEFSAGTSGKGIHRHLDPAVDSGDPSGCHSENSGLA